MYYKCKIGGLIIGYICKPSINLKSVRMKTRHKLDLPIGAKALILSKLYYSVLSKNLETLDVERYFSILYFLYNNNGCSQQQICNNLVIDKTAMVKVIDYLMKAGFVERKVNSEDRREHFITLTEKGHAQTAEIVKAFQALDDEIFAGISKHDKDVFLDVLFNVSDNLKAMPATDLFFNYKRTGAKHKKTTVNKSEPNNENT